MRKPSRSLTLAALLLIVPAAVWFAAFLLLGDSVPYLGYINAAGFFFGLAALAGGLFLLARRWVAAVPAIALGLFVLHMGVALPAPRAAAPPGSIPLRVVSASLRTANTDMADAAHVLDDMDADVFAVQEAADPDALLQGLRARRGGAWNMASSGNSAIISRLPVRPAAAPAEAFGAAVTIAPGAELLVWTLHAPKDYADPNEISRWFGALANAVDEQAPDIVAGDFNATPWNGGYRSVAALMTDAFRRGGMGPGFTFPTRARRMGTLFPFVRIDHIFLGPRLRVVRAFVEEASRGADHSPLVADLVIPPAPQPSRRIRNGGMRSD